jgi:hypothetical protein
MPDDLGDAEVAAAEAAIEHAPGAEALGTPNVPPVPEVEAPPEAPPVPEVAAAPEAPEAEVPAVAGLQGDKPEPNGPAADGAPAAQQQD